MEQWDKWLQRALYASLLLLAWLFIGAFVLRLLEG